MSRAARGVAAAWPAARADPTAGGEYAGKIRSTESMSVPLDTRSPNGVPAVDPAATRSARRPAARALALVSQAGLVLGLLGLAAFIPVMIRLLESWRVSPDAVSHRVSILGQRLSYPAANVGALIVLGLALLGGIATATLLFAIGRELRHARRQTRRLAELQPVAHDGVFVIEDQRVQAFCAGLARPRVYITTGALAILDEESLSAVLCHERHHARRRDPLRLAASRVIARSFFFLPGIRELRRRQHALAEVSADESAVAAADGDRSALARAMLSFDDATSGIDPVRVDYLLGEPMSWRFPVAIFGAAVALLAVIVTATILVGRAATGSATLEPPFLSAQPCIVMLALIPCAIGLVSARFGRVARGRATGNRHADSRA